MDVNALPDDPETLKATLRKVIDQHNSLVDRLELVEDRLALELARRYGPRSERYPFEAEGQGKLFEDGQDPQTVSPEDDEKDDEPERLESSRPKRRKGKNGRRRLPEHLERKEILLDVPEEERECTGWKIDSADWQPLAHRLSDNFSIKVIELHARINHNGLTVDPRRTF